MQLYKATRAKFDSNKANVEGLLSLETIKPARRAVLEECQANELTEYEQKIN